MTQYKKWNPEAKAKVVAALRSGDYKQTTGCLHDIGGYCCLGVASDVYLKERGLEWVKHSDPLSTLQGINSEYACLPSEVEDWLGADECNPHLYVKDVPTDDYAEGEFSMSACNDDLKLTFNQIADLIEAQL